ncbi:MAG TPA: hypothetical protein VFW22_09305, partial [Pseudolabrys sp.]|nr:hypothetical protein [Pseudolabrys sp.]
MGRARSHRSKYRHWRTIAFAGVFSFAATLLAMEILSARAISLTSPTIIVATVAGSLFGVCIAGAVSGWHIRRKLAGQNQLLD